MPDCTDIDAQEFARNLAALAPPPPGETTGGIIYPDKYKSFVVNIRPTTWRSEKIWIGQITNYVDAQFIADLVYYYIGRPCFHLPNANFDFPALECTGASTPLTSREMCFEYAVSIARGPKAQRMEYRKCVKKMALEMVKRAEVQMVLQQIRDENVPAVIGARIHEEEEGVEADPPMEVYGPKHVPLVLASHEEGTRNVDGLNAHILGFDMGGTGFRLQSALTPVDSWAEAYLAGMKDYHGSLNHDAEDFCRAGAGVLFEENSCGRHSAMGNFAVNFFAMEDTAFFETGESSSNFS